MTNQESKYDYERAILEQDFDEFKDDPFIYE
jgi:hypothetical protein